MPVYRRNYEGEYFFFTVVTRYRRNLFDNPLCRTLLSEEIKAAQSKYPWDMTAMVLLPDHLHMIWRLPDNDRDYSRRISLFKRRFSQRYLQSGGNELAISESQKKEGYSGIWQRKFWEHTIRNAADFNIHMDYIHINPVKHGLAEKTADWPWSSFHKYVKLGWYEKDLQGRSDLPENIEYYWCE